jgi:hypothetical protein
MRFRSLSETPGRPRNARETVMMLTPRESAMVLSETLGIGEAE